MTIDTDLITGISIGFEYVPADEEDLQSIILDIVFIRILIQW